MWLQVVVYVQRLIAKHTVSAPKMSAVPYLSDLLSSSDFTLHILSGCCLMLVAKLWRVSPIYMLT